MSERSVNEDNLQGSWVELHYSGPPAGQEAEEPEEVLSGSPPAGQEEPEEVLSGSAREEEAVTQATSEEEPGPGLVQAVVLGTEQAGTEVPLRGQEVAEIQARLQGGEKGSGSGQGEVQRPGLPQAGVQGGENGSGPGQGGEKGPGSGQGGEQRPGPGQGGEQRPGSGQGGEQRAGLPQAAVQGVDLEKMLLDAQHESGRSSSRGSLPCDSPPRSQTPLHLRCGSDTHSSAEKNSSQSEEDYLDRRREVENLMKKNADWIWDWSSRPENLPPKELLLRLPKRSTPLSIRNTRVMKKGGIFSSDFLKLFLPSLLLSHVLAVGLGVYIGRRLIPPPSNF